MGQIRKLKAGNDEETCEKAIAIMRECELYGKKFNFGKA